MLRYSRGTIIKQIASFPEIEIALTFFSMLRQSNDIHNTSMNCRSYWYSVESIGLHPNTQHQKKGFENANKRKTSTITIIINCKMIRSKPLSVVFIKCGAYTL